MKRRAVFLDRDGTLNEDIGYPSNSGHILIYPFSFEAVKKINGAGFLAIVITNQSGIGRGLLTERDLESIHQNMKASFAANGARLDAFYYCPHYLDSLDPKYRDDCACRKPFPGMGLQAAAALDIDLGKSYMIGDKVEDILFGINLQSRPVLVLTGYGKDSLLALQKQGNAPAHVAADLLEAVNWILDREKITLSDP
jgi:D-glycero-D-manno-heptose 1,7-bisphosphate phosphatase